VFNNNVNAKTMLYFVVDCKKHEISLTLHSYLCPS